MCVNQGVSTINEKNEQKTRKTNRTEKNEINRRLPWSFYLRSCGSGPVPCPSLLPRRSTGEHAVGVIFIVGIVGYK